MRDDSGYMELAIKAALRSPSRPFGAVLVDVQRDTVVAEGHNRTDENPLWHGEVDAINQLAARDAAADWSRLSLYSTAEPCPMCQSSILWAGIRRVVYGVSITQLCDFGWRQITIPADEVISRAPFANCELIGGVRDLDCGELFRSAGPPL